MPQQAYAKRVRSGVSEVKCRGCDGSGLIFVLGRVVKHGACGGQGTVQMWHYDPLVICMKCSGDGRLGGLGEANRDCPRCGGIGVVES